MLDEVGENAAFLISPIGPNGGDCPSMVVTGDVSFTNLISESIGPDDMATSCKFSINRPSVCVIDNLFTPRMRLSLKFTISSRLFPIHLSGISNRLVSP